MRPNSTYTQHEVGYNKPPISLSQGQNCNGTDIEIIYNESPDQNSFLSVTIESRSS